MRIKEMLKNKRLLTILVLIFIIIIGLVIFSILSSDDKEEKVKADYYYKYEYDNNLVTQSVWIYNKDDELQTKYFIFYKDEMMAYTKGEKAVLVMQRLDLKDHPIIQIRFEDDKDEKLYDVEYRE